MIKCAHCEELVNDDMAICPSCGCTIRDRIRIVENTDSIERTVEMYVKIGVLSALFILITFVILSN